MADSEKPTPKKVVEVQPNSANHSKVQLKPAPKKVSAFGWGPINGTSPPMCVCEERTPFFTFCYIHYRHIFPKARREEAPVTQVPDQVEDEIDEILDSNEEQHVAKKIKKDAAEKPHIQYSPENVCVYKWAQIRVGQKYKAMSVGQESRSRTGMVLVPI